MKDADVVYYPAFFNNLKAIDYFKTLYNTINWKQDHITLFGKTHLQPRLTAFFAENLNSYSYSNIVMKPNLFTPELLEIKTTVESHLKLEFTSCLANLYRDGSDSNGWHADNEKELGSQPIIASVSFGAERVFHFKHRHIKEEKRKFVLGDGSLLLMRGDTQKYWLHQVSKTRKNIGKRINLTFRIIA